MLKDRNKRSQIPFKQEAADSEIFLLCFAVDDKASLRYGHKRFFQQIREHFETEPVLVVGMKEDRRKGLNLNGLSCFFVDDLTVRNICEDLGAVGYVTCTVSDVNSVRSVLERAVDIVLNERNKN